MTICIAGICDGQGGIGRKAIAVADRMVTAGDTTFEQVAFSKIIKITENSLAMTSGSALAHTELFNSIKAKFSGMPRPPIAEVVDQVKQNYVRLRTLRAEERHFKPLGLTIPHFLANQRTLDSTVVLRLSQQLEKANFGLWIMIVGVDTTGSHIYYIVDPGTSECFDGIGYCSIGSGQRHADSALIINDYCITLPTHKALYLMYDAKKRAERAPGVGSNYTDISIVSNNGIHNLSDSEIQQLQNVYSKYSEEEKGCRSKMDNLIQQLSITEDVKNDKT